MKKTKKGRQIYMLELDGSIRRSYNSIQEAENSLEITAGSICSTCSDYDKDAPNSGTAGGFGWCWVESFHSEVANQSLLNSFPEIDCSNPLIDYDKLRYYVENRFRPVWQLELDGTRLKLWTSVTAHGIPKNICAAIKNNKTAGGYGWEYASALDICVENNPYQRKVVSFLKNVDLTRQMDCELIRESIKRGTGLKPVWEIDESGVRLKKWANRGDAEEYYELGRNLIEQVCNRGIGLAGGKMWEYATFYLDDNCDENSYRKISYAERLMKPIEQCDMDGNVIKVFNHPKYIYETLGFYVSLSYPVQNNFIFKLGEKKKLNRNKIAQMDLDGNIIKIWDDTASNVAKHFGKPRTTLSACINIPGRTFAGFKWKNIPK